MIFASLIAKLGFDTSAWKSGKQQVVQDIGEIDAKHKSLSATIKSNFGKTSAIGQISKLLAGGGIVAGIGFAVKEIKHLAEAWSGAEAAADAATAAAKHYTDQVKAIHDAEHTREASLKGLRETLNSTKMDAQVMAQPEGRAREEAELAANDYKQQDATRAKIEAIKDQMKLSAENLNDLDRERRIKKETLDNAQASLKEETSAYGRARVGHSLRQAQAEKEVAEAKKEVEGIQNLMTIEANRQKILHSGLAEAQEAAEGINKANHEIYLRKMADLDAKYVEKAKTDAIEAEKEKTKAKEKISEEYRQAAIQQLEMQQDDIKDAMKREEEYAKAGSRRAEVSAIRGGSAGIVLEKEADPNTPIFKEQLKRLGEIDQSLKQLKSKDTESEVAVSF